MGFNAVGIYELFNQSSESGGQSLILVRPKNKGDIILAYTHAWCEEIIEKAKVIGRSFVDIEGENVTRESVESALQDKSKNFVHFSSHGEKNLIFGCFLQPIILAGENDHLLKSKDVYAHVCFSATILGASAIENGAKSYLGYENEYCFAYEIGYAGDLNEDIVAKPFKECSNIITLSVLEGKSIVNAWEESQKKHQYWIDYWLNNNLPTPEKVVATLLDNKKHQLLRIGGQ